jgi:heptosyltransferase-2
LGALGGVLRATPLFLGIKKKYPNVELWVLTKKDAFPLIFNNKTLDKIFIWEENREYLKNEAFDWVINTEDDFETCNFLSYLNTKKITGPYIKGGHITYTKDSALFYDMGKISKFGINKANELKKLNNRSYQDIYCEILSLNKNGLFMNLELTQSEKEYTKKFLIKNNLTEKDLIVGVNTGAGTNWPLKSLSIEKTVTLIETLSQSGFKVILLGGTNELERNKEILKMVKSEVINAGIDNDLRHFIAIINALNILVTSDTLALHIGVALRKRIVSFFGPTSAEEIELYNQGIKIKPKSNCYCCYKKKREKREMCIDNIKVEDLVEGVISQSNLF